MVAATAEQHPSLKDVLLRVVRRPGPWLLRYLLVTLPALSIALIAMSTLRSWFRYPLFVEALRTRSLDLLLETVQSPEGLASGGLPPGLGIAVLLIPVTLLLLRALWLLTEGGILTVYANAAPVGGRGFLRACWRWFGSFILLGLIWLIFAAAWGAGVAVLAYLARTIETALAVAVIAVGVGGLAITWFWLEIARATAVVRNDHNVFRALAGSVKIAGLRPGLLVAIILSWLALQVLVVLASRGLSSVLPYAWWLLAFIVQQLAQFVSTGLTLVRRAGEVGLAVQALPDGSEDV